jgi:hypothetical protein
MTVKDPLTKTQLSPGVLRLHLEGKSPLEDLILLEDLNESISLEEYERRLETFDLEGKLGVNRNILLAHLNRYASLRGWIMSSSFNPKDRALKSEARSMQGLIRRMSWTFQFEYPKDIPQFYSLATTPQEAYHWFHFYCAIQLTLKKYEGELLGQRFSAKAFSAVVAIASSKERAQKTQIELVAELECEINREQSSSGGHSSLQSLEKRVKALELIVLGIAL